VRRIVAVKKLILATLILSITGVIWSNQEKAQGAEVREYLAKCNRLLEKHINAFSAASDAQQTVHAMQRYAKDMKPMLQASRAMTKKYPPNGGQDTGIRAEIEDMNSKVIKINELLGGARKKYGNDKKFQDAEKVLINTGLFGRQQPA
jgi:hypothetical protein